jgi:uncharacterized membrane protein YqgA involved in biofilm formation
MDDLTPYSNRELDKAFRRADDRADEFHNTLMQRMDIFESNTGVSLHTIEKQVLYTNGKLRKIIIALVLLAGIVIGQALKVEQILPALLHLVI